MNEKYLDRKSKFNKKTFDKFELFNLVEEILQKNKIPHDDFKGNIFVNNDPKIADWDEDSLSVKCTFSFIIYLNEIPKKDFNQIGEKIEQIFRDTFQLENEDDVKCYRFDDSEYADNGYDVEIKLYLKYAFEE